MSAVSGAGDRPIVKFNVVSTFKAFSTTQKVITVALAAIVGVACIAAALTAFGVATLPLMTIGIIGGSAFVVEREALLVIMTSEKYDIRRRAVEYESRALAYNKQTIKKLDFIKTKEFVETAEFVKTAELLIKAGDDYYEQSKLLIAAEDIRGSKTALNKAIDEFNSAKLLCYDGRFSRQSKEATQKYLIISCYKLAEAYKDVNNNKELAKENFEKAVETYEKAAKTHELGAETHELGAKAYEQLAQIYVKAENIVAAQENFGKAAHAYKAANNHLAAAKTYERAARIGITDEQKTEFVNSAIESYKAQAEVFKAANNHIAAAQVYERAARIVGITTEQKTELLQSAISFYKLQKASLELETVKNVEAIAACKKKITDIENILKSPPLPPPPPSAVV